ncbi:MAG: hypothetical protein KAX49_05675 [Halanaerobiales bacterium]|nr:hypothetical protein [Halanaerobiales bacterium]
MIEHSGIQQLHDLLIQAFGRSLKIWGVSETLGRLFGLLYMADEPLSLDQMAKELFVSKATISINIRTLESLKCVKKIWQKGSRKDFYVVERDFQKIMQELLRTNGMAEVEVSKQAISQALAGYNAILESDENDEIKELVKNDQEKLNYLIKWIDFGERWISFFLKNDSFEEVSEEVKRIEVEWEDEA